MFFTNFRAFNSIICPTFEVSKIVEYEKNEMSGGGKAGYYKSSPELIVSGNFSTETQRNIEFTKKENLTTSDFSNNLKLFAQKIIDCNPKPLVVLFIDEAQVQIFKYIFFHSNFKNSYYQI